MPATYQSRPQAVIPIGFAALRTSLGMFFGVSKNSYGPRGGDTPPPYDNNENMVTHRVLFKDDSLETLYEDVRAMYHNPSIVSKDLEVSSSYIRIDANDTPQWDWTKSECRGWFYALLTTKLGYTAKNASTLAAKLDGFGPNIYMRTIEDWTELLENEEEGLGVYAWVLEGEIWRALFLRRFIFRMADY